VGVVRCSAGSGEKLKVEVEARKDESTIVEVQMHNGQSCLYMAPKTAECPNSNQVEYLSYSF
jgi:hypothetical protein